MKIYDTLTENVINVSDIVGKNKLENDNANKGGRYLALEEMPKEKKKAAPKKKKTTKKKE